MVQYYELLKPPPLADDNSPTKKDLFGQYGFSQCFIVIFAMTASCT